VDTDQKRIDKLIKKWELVRAVLKKASKNYQEAFARYHWTAADDGAKWKRVLALRDKETAAFEKADAAWEALPGFVRKRLR
jgi:hypothetical protein